MIPYCTASGIVATNDTLKLDVDPIGYKLLLHVCGADAEAGSFPTRHRFEVPYDATDQDPPVPAVSIKRAAEPNGEFIVGVAVLVVTTLESTA